MKVERTPEINEIVSIPEAHRSAILKMRESLARLAKLGFPIDSLNNFIRSSKLSRPLDLFRALEADTHNLDKKLLDGKSVSYPEFVEQYDGYTAENLLATLQYQVASKGRQGGQAIESSKTDDSGILAALKDIGAAARFLDENFSGDLSKLYQSITDTPEIIFSSLQNSVRNHQNGDRFAPEDAALELVGDFETVLRHIKRNISIGDVFDPDFVAAIETRYLELKGLYNEGKYDEVIQSSKAWMTQNASHLQPESR